jgi:hypothetical protein
VDAVAVYVGQEVGILAVEGIVAIFAIVSIWIVLRFRDKFSQNEESFGTQEVEPVA